MTVTLRNNYINAILHHNLHLVENFSVDQPDFFILVNFKDFGNEINSEEELTILLKYSYLFGMILHQYGMAERLGLAGPGFQCLQKFTDVPYVLMVMSVACQITVRIKIEEFMLISPVGINKISISEHKEKLQKNLLT